MSEKVLLFERKLPPRTLSTCVLCNCSGWTGYIKNSNISKIVDNLRKHPGCWGWDLPLTLAHKGGGDLLLQAPHKPPLFRTPPKGGNGGSKFKWSLNPGIGKIGLTHTIPPLILATWRIWPKKARKCDSRHFSTKVRKSFFCEWKC